MTDDSSRAAWLSGARSYLRDADPVLARLIDDRPDSIPGRGYPSGGQLPVPAELLDTEPDQLRAAGLSWRKISALRDLAGRLSDGRLDTDVLSRLPDEALITELTAIPGIGPWTVQGAAWPPATCSQPPSTRAGYQGWSFP